MNRNMARRLESKLWSTRTNSSRQSYLCGTEPMKNSAPGVPEFGSEIIGNKNWAFGSTGTWLLGKCAPVVGSATGQSAKEPFSELGQRSEKSPERSACEGTATL